MGVLYEKDGNFSLMVIVEWTELQELRGSFGLPPNHPHITVGFRDHDIHGVPKDRSILIDAILGKD